MLIKNNKLKVVVEEEIEGEKGRKVDGCEKRVDDFVNCC